SAATGQSRSEDQNEAARRSAGNHQEEKQCRESVMSKIIPERIREARESVGLTDEQFADQIGVTRQAVGAYETGAASPRGDVFSKIIAVTHQPPAFFTTARKRNAERFRMPNWRSLKRMQRPDRLRIGRRLEWAYHITEFAAEFVDLPPVSLPEIRFDFEADGG